MDVERDARHAEPDDGDLLRRSAGGDADAFARLVARHEGALFRFAARTWLFQVVIHSCRRHHRRRAREPAEKGGVDEAAALAAPESGPERRTAARQAGAAIDAALAAMDPEAREVLILRDVDGLSGEEAAAALGIGLAAMKSRLHRSRLELKERVEASLGHPVEEVIP